MALTKLTKDMDIIQKLGDEPNDVDGLSSAELKAKFDEGNNAMKQWVNETFIPEVEQEIKASRLENLPEHAHTHAQDGRDPITPESIGARPDTWLPTAEEVGAAPAGKGYGDAFTAIEATSASETYAEYCAKVDAVLANMPYRTSMQVAAYPPDLYGLGAQVATLARNNAKYATLTSVIGYDPDVFGWRMVLKNGVWQPLEWLNPPMKLGVEYRTTERYMGKPVYTMLVDFGTMPNSTTKDVTFSTDTSIRSFDVTGEIYNGSSLVRDGVGIRAIENKVRITTTSDYSSYKARMTVKYYKTTD